MWHFLLFYMFASRKYSLQFEIGKNCTFGSFLKFTADPSEEAFESLGERDKCAIKCQTNFFNLFFPK